MKTIEKLIDGFVNSKYSDISLRILKYVLIAVSVLFIYNVIVYGLPTGMLR